MARRFLIVGVVLALESAALAQSSPNDILISSFDPENTIAPASAIEGPGVKIGEGTILRPVFGIQTGFVSNVFYQNVDEQAVGVLRLIAQAGIASLSSQRLANPETTPESETNEGSFAYRADLTVSYDAMLTTDDIVSGTGGLGLGLSFKGMANPMGTWSFGIDNQFARLIRAANFETDANVNRDINTLTLKLLYHPKERSINGYAYLQNTIDLFERGEQSFADRTLNRFGVHPIWQWLPHTSIYADLSIGLNAGLGTDNMKSSSYPFTALAGIATLLSLKTTFNLQAGYTNGIYAVEPSYSAPVIGAQIGYRYSPLGRVAATYEWMYQDSVNANYFRDHVVRLWWQQLFAPIVLMAQPEIHFREYNGISIVNGPPVRNDVIVSIIAGMQYNLRNWLAATLNYHFTMDETDYLYMVDGAIDDPSYIRHELLLGMRMAL